MRVGRRSRRRLDKWQAGHTPVEQAVERVKLTRFQRLELFVLVNLLGAVRPVYWLVRRVMRRPFGVASDFNDAGRVSCKTQGTKFHETHGDGYLTVEQVATFERDGVIGPLPLLSRAEAAELRKFYEHAHEANWHGRHMIGEAKLSEMKQNDRWSLNQSGYWQELNFDEIRDVVRRPILAERLASLLGDDVVAWRSQVFDIPTNGKGTFWHSATTFTGYDDVPILSPPPDMSPALANINCWIALEDVDETNSCMHVVPGSHTDNRLDSMLSAFMRDRYGFIMSYRRAERRQALIAIRYSGDIFVAAQLGFAKAMDLAPDMYDEMDPVAYPMKAGEVLIFSSNAVHCSQANQRSQRLAMGMRCTSSNVGIYENQDTISFSTGAGLIDITTERIRAGTTLHTVDGPVDTIDLRDSAISSAPGPRAS